jgi:SAM-dependent methyltransferase
LDLIKIYLLCFLCSNYLFHELPNDIRKQAVAEMARVLRPGGLCILTDSVQLGDRDSMNASLGNFEDFNGKSKPGLPRPSPVRTLKVLVFIEVSAICAWLQSPTTGTTLPPRWARSSRRPASCAAPRYALLRSCCTILHHPA